MSKLEFTSSYSLTRVTYSEEPADELTQEELRRLITLAREVKGKRAAALLIQPGVKGDQLYIKPYYDKAA